jgi:hypothetical protein
MGAAGLARPFPCGVGFVDAGSPGPADDFACQNGPVGNQNDWPSIDPDDLTVFGFNDWIRLSKQEAGGALEQPVDIDLMVQVTAFSNGDPVGGTWEFNPAVWGTYENVMIVLKDGNVGGIFWSAYLVSPAGTSSGNWSMPRRGLSHLSVYGRERGVPEPTVLSLAALALLGAGLMSRRRR